MPVGFEFTVLTPGLSYPIKPHQNGIQIQTFRYGPFFLQNLAHGPGGVMASLKRNKFNFLVLPLFCLAMLIACIRAARTNDLIHANWSINGVIAGLAGLVTKTPVITTLRGSDVNLATSSRLHFLIMKLCMILTTKVATVSQAIANKITQLLPQYRDKISFIPNGVEKDFLTTFNKPDNTFNKLITSGNLVKGKGVDIIIRAMAELPESLNAELIVLGDGPELDKLIHMAETHGLTKDITFQGKVPPAQIPHYLSQANIFILASFSEGRPNVVIEAMAAGLSVISSDIEGVREVVDNGTTGLLFESGNHLALSKTINTLINDHELQSQLSKNASQYIRDNGLSWPVSAEKYVRLYEECLEKEVSRELHKD